MGSIVGAPGLWSTGLVVVVHRLGCPEACGIFLTVGPAQVPCVGTQVLLGVLKKECSLREEITFNGFLSLRKNQK